MGNTHTPKGTKTKLVSVDDRGRIVGEIPIGRPTVVTPEVLLKLEQAFAIDATAEEACSYADISQSTFYLYLKNNPDFSERISDLRNRPILKARQTVVKGIEQNYSNAMDYLQRKRKAEFQLSQKVDLNAKITISDILNEIEDEARSEEQSMENTAAVPDSGQAEPPSAVQEEPGAGALQPDTPHAQPHIEIAPTGLHD